MKGSKDELDRRLEKTAPVFSGKIRQHLLKNTNILQENYHYFFVINFSALVALFIHLIFLLIFTLLHLKTLAIFNIVSVFCYMLCFTANRKGHHFLAQALMSIEITLHSLVAVAFLGWGSGFYVYIIGSVTLICLSPSRKYLRKSLIVLCFILFYIGLSILGENFQPLAAINAAHLKAFFYGNSIAMLLMLASLIEYYQINVNRAERQLRQANHRLSLLAITDPLTNLLNRRGMDEILQNEAERFKSSSRIFCIILADIDDFKNINDQYGHECGDFVLTAISDRLKNALREHDQVARWGGEEFLILLPETNGERGKKIAERLQLQTEENLFHYKKQAIPLTLTLGLTVFDGTRDITSCINEADEALRGGKLQGKNRVVFR